MAASYPMDSVLPWQSDADEDRRFKKWLFHGIGVCCMVSVLFPLLPVVETKQPTVERKRTEYTRLLIEERKLPPPIPAPAIKKKTPAVVKAEPKKVKKQRVEPVVATPVKKMPQPKPIDVAKKAREKAAKSGVLAFADDLATMRQRKVSVKSKRLTQGKAQAVVAKRNLLAVKSTQAAATGIAGVSLEKDTGEIAVSQRTGVVVQSVVSDAVIAELNADAYATSMQNAGRSAQSVRKIMDENKGAVYGIYNRALRKNPMLVGQLSFIIVIEPSGKVNSVDVVNSELGDDALARKILARIRMIDFGEEPVEQTTVNYSFDFLPS